MKLNSTIAGTISSLALLMEVVFGMLIGNISDCCTSKMGRRRPFILIATIGIFPVMFLLLRTVNLSPEGKFFYYLFFAILFRVFFSCFEIPNNALGAELVSDYDGRTRLRTLTRFFSIVGNGIGYIIPLIVLQCFGCNTQTGWQTSGILYGIICFFSWGVAFRNTSGMGVVLSENRVKKKVNRANDIATSYLELLRLRVTKILVIYKAAFTCGYALFNVSTIYYLQFSVRIGNRYISYLYILTVIIFFIATPAINKTAISLGKVKQQLLSLLSCGLVGISVFFLAPSNFIAAGIYIGFFALMQTSFWQLSSAIFYDVIEVDEWVNGKRREGDLMSMVSVLGTLISAVMIQFLGIALDMAGYDSLLSVQPDSAVTFMNVAFILIPSIFLLIGALVLKIFPLN